MGTTPNRLVGGEDSTVTAQVAVDEATSDPPEHVTVPTPTSLTVVGAVALEPGAMLGDYRIEGKLGEGGWGAVFSSIHPLIGKHAAIKILKKELCGSPSAVERFIDEARLVNAIGHPNIVDIFSFGELLGGQLYFVMEWLKGESLAQRMARGPVSVPELCTIVRPLARALEAAHKKGVIHRDLKPANVFLVELDGEPPMVKLLDFGIAKLANNRLRTEKTSTGEIIGTPQYIAPEQARGREIDHRVDIYALGGILFELLTRRSVFVVDNAADMIAAHLTEPAPRPSAVAPGVPPALDDLVVRMLAKAADERPTLAELCDVLVTVANPESAPRRGSAQPARRRLVAGAIAVLAIAGIAVVVARHGSREVATSQPDAAVAVAVAPAIATEPQDAAPALPAVAKPPDHAEEPAPRHPRVAPAPRTGKLVLSIAGAASPEIVVDHKPAVLGHGGELALSPGVHAVEVRAPGMLPEAFRVEIAAGVPIRKSVTLRRETSVEPRAGSGDDHMLFHSGDLKRKP